MRKTFQVSTVLVMSILSVQMAMSSDVTNTSWQPQIKAIGSVNLQGSFLSPQALYADSERIFACSYQGDLFVLERDRQGNFPLIQTVRLGMPLTAVRGDENNLYVTSRDGNLYVFSKTWPIQLVRSIGLSNYGLAGMEVVGTDIYVAKGQAAMTASKSRLFLSPMNPGDVGVDFTNMRSYGEQFERSTTKVFDRLTLEPLGSIPNTNQGGVKISTWQDFLYLTSPGCCGMGIDVYDAATLQRIQSINRFTTNTVAGTRKKGIPLLVGGTESGAVDLFVFANNRYEFSSTADLPGLTGLIHPEDIEIRSLWVDGLDNLVFAGSSWGNDRSRGPNLPSFFILEIR